MRKIFFIFLAVAASSALFAQQTKTDKREERRKKINAMIKEEEEGVIAYQRHTIFGLKLVNDGYGAFLEIGRAQSIKKALLFQLDISERKHVKENKQSDQQYPGPSIIFGKINFFYPVKLGVQQQILLGNKSNKNGVSVTANFGGGISLGFLRPYFLEINDTSKTPLERKSIRYESADSATFTNPSDLFNLQATGPSFTKGWGNLKLTPGLYAKSALRFDYGRYNEVVSAIEVGVTAEYYTKNIPQVVSVKEKKLFVGAYVSILFGKRK
ncbi:MAG: hypothetical protein H7334_03735 [Ferruginibacter sp.]|nr:hypothetical protein [Ferruginibacter sp.]